MLILTYGKVVLYFKGLAAICRMAEAFILFPVLAVAIAHAGSSVAGNGFRFLFIFAVRLSGIDAVDGSSTGTRVP
jgi:hypothetical protein